MKILMQLLILISLTLALSCTRQVKSKTLIKNSEKAKMTQTTVLKAKNSFTEVKKSYKSLLPIENGYFITYKKIEAESYKNFLFDLHKLKKDEGPFFANEHGKTELLFEDLFELLSKNPKSKIEKWGVIDSSGTEIVPFVCDAIKSISKDQLLLGLYNSSKYMQTGLVRYKYFGNLFIFEVKNKSWKSQGRFEKIIDFKAKYDFFSLIELGHEYYLPE